MDVLIRFSHGLGDAVQLTVVLRHLQEERPDWSIDVQALPGKVSAISGLCRRAFWRDDERRSHYDQTFELDWWEPDGAYGDRIPATKAERCLREVFKIAPRRELSRYSLAIPDQARRTAADYLRSVSRLGSDGRFRAVLFHYEGNTATEAKNLRHDEIEPACRFVLSQGLVPVVLDWDRRSPLPATLPGVVCPDSTHPLWNGAGVGDAATIAALAAQVALSVGIDSGPQKCFGASGAPTIGVWRRLHPIHYYALNENVLHLVPEDHFSLIRGDAASRRLCERMFLESYRSTTYGSNLAERLIQEMRIVLQRNGTHERQKLVAYSFCASHRKSGGVELTPAEHWQMLATSMEAWNPGRTLPELVSIVGPLTEPVPEQISRRAALVASPTDPGHQMGAWTAIQQAALYARQQGFERLAFVADDVLPCNASAIDLATRLEAHDYVGSYWGKPGELNTQVFAARVDRLFDGNTFLLRPGDFPCLEERMSAVFPADRVRLDHLQHRDYIHTHRSANLRPEVAKGRGDTYPHVEQLLLSRRWVYARLGYDARPVRFEQAGPERWISEGRGGNEQLWRLKWNEDVEAWSVRLSGDNGGICELQLDVGPRWWGRWLQFEGMPIVLSPIDERATVAPLPELSELYERLTQDVSDVYQHLPTLRRLASECDHVTELGTREGRSTCALLAAQPGRLLSIDINDCSNPRLLTMRGKTDLEFRQGDSCAVEIESTDLLFIDTWHTYDQLTRELARHAGRVRRAIAFHDTQTFGDCGEDQSQPGLRRAIQEFLSARGEWYISEAYPQNNGLTVIRRVNSTEKFTPRMNR